MNLADAMRPGAFNDIVGQSHLTSKGSLLRSLVESTSFDSIMLVGPSGTGKTSMAEVIGKTSSLSVYKLHAAVSGTNDLKRIAEQSLYEQNIIVFIDEIHRFNKSQQDILLKLIDDRKVKLIGASAENPYFNLIPALRSRSLLFTFNALSKDDFIELFNRSQDVIKKLYKVTDIKENGVIESLIDFASGDCRRFLNLLEMAVLTGQKKSGIITLSNKDLESILPVNKFSDDEYYDILSALIKSIRGSDPDAALLWCFKLIKNGVQPEAVFRRLMISASEDIGNAYPDGQVFINACFNSFMNVGVPEGYIILAHAVTFLASCPKSNRSYNGYHKVMDYLAAHDPKVPDHIVNKSKDYKYPFNYGNFVLQDYSDSNEIFYNPSDYGFEQKIRKRLEEIWKNKKNYE